MGPFFFYIFYIASVRGGITKSARIFFTEFFLICGMLEQGRHYSNLTALRDPYQTSGFSIHSSSSVNTIYRFINFYPFQLFLRFY